jgi:phosphoribosylaminoimidazole-succinocarboxamide synthase
MTSVKEFRVDTEPTPTALGEGRFVFTDAYSVFDWGQMPDAIPQKGASLCTMGAFNFELLEKQGVPTHYRGVVDAEGKVTELSACSEPPTEMAIELTQVPDLPYIGGQAEAGGYDYEAYHEAAGENFLIPLEIVFRNTVPVGSSLRKRGNPADYGLDFESWPDKPVDLPEPVVEFSTKYEEQDRYVSREEADRIAGKASIEALESVALTVNEKLTEHAASMGFAHEDGKIECLYHDGTVAVADVVGTFDENRFSIGGHQLSKEVIRQYYKRNQPEWVKAVSVAKANVATAEGADWRPLCDVDPVSLPSEVIEAVAAMYAAGANAYTGEEWFDAPAVETAVDALSEL